MTATINHADTVQEIEDKSFELSHERGLVTNGTSSLTLTGGREERYEAPTLLDAETLATQRVITACGVCITGGGAVTQEEVVTTPE